MESISTVPVAAKTKLTFAYDWQGRRIEKKVYTWDAGTNACDTLATDTRFVYDSWNLIAEMDATNTVTRSYFWGQDLSGSLQGAGGVGGLVSVTTSGATAGTYLPAYDANGDVLGLVNSQGGTTATYEYGPFGEVVRASGVMAEANPFQFSTHYTDQETGLVYAKRRYYNPSTGRFVSRDPKGERRGVNLLAYCQNNSISECDPLGLGSWNITIKNPGGIALGGLIEPPVILASYTMDKKDGCCTSFTINRSATTSFLGWPFSNPHDTNPNLPVTPGNAYQPGRSDADQPGPALWPMTFHFQWAAICTAGPRAGHVLSTTSRDYTLWLNKGKFQ